MIVLLRPPVGPQSVAVSRWDLLHLLYSVDHRPVSARDRRDLDGVFRRACKALS